LAVGGINSILLHINYFSDFHVGDLVVEESIQ